ncbi:MAG: hypothetical protein JSW39_07395 [Desulfobacterales bacterium]|nr:MAG: hypothetical protein JSW39_07395 [Desulfobacterales bacterium]
MTSFQIDRVDKFSMPFYVQAVFGILGRPRKFFSQLPLTVGMMPSLTFLVISALFFCVASLMNIRLHRFHLMGGIYLFNAVGMVFIMSALGYMVMILSIGKKVPFARLFSTYALCSGVTLLVAWVPYSVVFTEPWKWYLIGIGLTKGCGLKLREAALIIALSLALWILFFWSLLPIISR